MFEKLKIKSLVIKLGKKQSAMVTFIMVGIKIMV